MIHVEEAALNALKQALETAGQEYKQNLAKLESLIEEITTGDIQGEPAQDLLAKYNAKKDALDRITQIIEEAEGYVGIQTTKFDNLIGDLKSEMM